MAWRTRRRSLTSELRRATEVPLSRPREAALEHRLWTHRLRARGSRAPRAQPEGRHPPVHQRDRVRVHGLRVRVLLSEGRQLERAVAATPHESHPGLRDRDAGVDRKSTRLNSSHANISYAVFCLKKKKNTHLQ